MKHRTVFAIGGVLAGMLMAAQPGLAREQDAGAKPQAAPSVKPMPKERTGKVDPFTVGAVPNPGPKAIGTEQAAPSKLPAPKATPEAVESHQGKVGSAPSNR